MTRRNLVTGGAGFLGRHVTARLRERGEAVRILDVRSPPDASPATSVRVGSVTDPDAVRGALEGVDRVFHLAAKTGLWDRDVGAFERVNRDGARTVFREALAAGVDRLVHVSTEAILRDFGRPWRDALSAGGTAAGEADGRPSPDAVGDGRSLDGGRVPDPGGVPGPYCRSKALGEEEARRALRDGLPVTVVNPTVPVGPGDRGRTPPGRMLLGFLAGEIPGYTPGALDLVDVRDLAEGVVRAADRGTVGGRYVLGGTRLRVRSFLDMLEEASGRPMPRLRIPYPVALCVAFVSEVIADRVTGRPPPATVAGVRLLRAPPLYEPGACRARLGLSPRPLAETLADTVEWLRREGLLDGNPRPRAG